MTPRFLRSSSFWMPFLISFVVLGLFFAWELDVFQAFIPSPPRSPETPWELSFVLLVLLLIPLNIGLTVWHNRYQQCPIGVKRATGVAGILSIVTLLCPVCIALPASLIVISTVASLIAPFLPLLQIVTLILLIAALWMLWPRN